MLEVEHLCFSYGKREVLRGVDLRAEPGELVFVLGANGAGKTTLFRCILGLLPGYQGCVRVDGCDVSSLAPRALAKKIAYIPQTSHMIFPYTALELVLMGTNHRLGLFSAPGRRERAIAMEALEELGIADYAHRSFAELSGGEQQLVLAARALAQQARLLLMDEPTSALDFGNQVRVLERVSALTLRGYTVLLSCHNPQHAMLYAQRVVALHDGLVAADGPPDQALDEALMRKLYGVPARFVRTGHGRSPVSGAPPGGAGVRRGVRARRVESGAGPLLPRGGGGRSVRRGHPPSGGTAPASQRGAPAVRCAGRHTGRALRRYGVLLLRPHG